MGGTAVNGKRMTFDIYVDIKNQTHNKLLELGIIHFIPHEVPEKTSFGDLDVLCVSSLNLYDTILNNFDFCLSLV